MNDFELRHIRYFVAVAEELHFGNAAKRLNIAQPPLSQQIRNFEDRIGYPLFVRTSRSVKLTPAGALLLERAKRTLRIFQEDIEAARSVARGEEGALSVGFVGSAMLTKLPEILGVYRKLYPRVHLRLTELYTSRLTAGLQEGILDVGLLRDSGPVEGLHVETVMSERYLLALPMDHPLAGHAFVR